MLRRKLFMNLGPLVLLLLVCAVAAIWMLEGIVHHYEAHGQSAAALVTSIRRIVMGLAAAFLVVINLSVVLLLWHGRMILRPVDKLIDATRALAEGRYDHRVRLDQRDEFDELARAFNGLAEKLGAEERRQLETLGQVALAMNHEINNAIAIIELQLRLLARQSPGGAAQEQYLREIHQSLERMTQTVAALKSVRRIVLTDYLPGVKMLDLERSQQPADERNVLVTT
jgi:signal transduction histidine kinase